MASAHLNAALHQVIKAHYRLRPDAGSCLEPFAATLQTVRDAQLRANGYDLHSWHAADAAVWARERQGARARL